MDNRFESFRQQGPTLHSSATGHCHIYCHIISICADHDCDRCLSLIPIFIIQSGGGAEKNLLDENNKSLKFNANICLKRPTNLITLEFVN